MSDGKYGTLDPPYSPVYHISGPTPPNETAVDGSWFFYAPNKGAPVFFAVGFAASGAFHIWQCM
jgi:hypothetical protein